MVTRYCYSCGTPVEEGTDFCESCGAAIPHPSPPKKPQLPSQAVKPMKPAGIRVGRIQLDMVTLSILAAVIVIVFIGVHVFFQEGEPGSIPSGDDITVQATLVQKIKTDVSSPTISQNNEIPVTQKIRSDSSSAGAKKGDIVVVDYTGSLANGSVFDSSREQGPFSFTLGADMAIPGFDKALYGMKEGEFKKITLSPEEAYGEYDPAWIQVMPVGFMPPGEKVAIGDQITLKNNEKLYQATVLDMNSTHIVLDLNPPLAGETLTFEVTVRTITRS